MGTSPTTQSALTSGAAKDDAIGDDGVYTFSIKGDLLNNDPGSTSKIVFSPDGTSSQFFFGDTAADQANQAAYLLAHDITDNGDGTFTLGENATDFNYFVQIGKEGTWSKAFVDVTAPQPEVPCEPVEINGSFEGTAAVNVTDWDITTVTGWDNTAENSGGMIEVWGAAGLASRTGGLSPQEGTLVIETDSSRVPCPPIESGAGQLRVQSRKQHCRGRGLRTVLQLRLSVRFAG